VLIRQKRDERVEGSRAISKEVAPQFPQKAYVGIEKTLQQE
jgi:hypothetical protein